MSFRTFFFIIPSSRFHDRPRSQEFGLSNTITQSHHNRGICPQCGESNDQWHLSIYKVILYYYCGMVRFLVSKQCSGPLENAWSKVLRLLLLCVRTVFFLFIIPLVT